MKNSQEIIRRGHDRSSLAGRRAARDILLLASTASISPERKTQLSRVLSGTVDWDRLLELAEFHGVSPLIARNLATNGLTSYLPRPYLDKLERIYKNNLIRNMLFSSELNKVLSVFKINGIEAITLKGTVLAEQLYGNPGLRTTVDIDILVPLEEMSRAGSVLREMDYQKTEPQEDRDHPFHTVYCRQTKFPVYVELHWDLEDPGLVSISLPQVWNRAQPLQLPGGAILVLSPEDNLLFLSNTFAKQDGQRLRSLCDITELVKKYGGGLDWDYVARSAGSFGIGAAAHYSLRWARELLEAPVPVSVIEALKPRALRRWLIGCLTSQDSFLSTCRFTKFKLETHALLYGLMMKYPRQTLLALSRYRGDNERIAWLRTAFWILLVFGGVLGRSVAGVVSRRK